MRMPTTTGNPAFRFMAADADAGALAASQAGTMTVQGTAVKTLILFAILLPTAAWSWIALGRGQLGMPVVWGSAIGGLVLGLVTIFKPTIAAYTAPVYAAVQGVFLGGISALFNAMYGGIVVNAVSLTMMTLFVMLLLYSNRIIVVTDKLRTGIVAATGAIFLVYMISFLMQMFGFGGMPFLHSNGLLGIGISLVIVGVAAFNLLLDFDFIEKGAYHGLPRNMEWYGAFGLMVTLIWLYLEILRLLAKLQSRD